jgi:hypothetical protein
MGIGEGNDRMNKMLRGQLAALMTVLERSGDHNTHWTVGESLNTIRDAVLSESSSEDRELLEKLALPIEVDKTGPVSLETGNGLRLCRQLLN